MYKSWTKVKKTTFTPLWIKKDMFVFDKKFREIRDRFKDKCLKCFKCNRPFFNDEKISLAAFKNKKNKVLCRDCADDLTFEKNEVENRENKILEKAFENTKYVFKDQEYDMKDLLDYVRAEIEALRTEGIIIVVQVLNGI